MPQAPSAVMWGRFETGACSSRSPQCRWSRWSQPRRRAQPLTGAPPFLTGAFLLAMCEFSAVCSSTSPYASSALCARRPRTSSTRAPFTPFMRAHAGSMLIFDRAMIWCPHLHPMCESYPCTSFFLLKVDGPIVGDAGRHRSDGDAAARDARRTRGRSRRLSRLQGGDA